jgi:hypothetical protein
MILAAFSVGVFAQEFTVDGEAKSGLLWTKDEDGINDAKEEVRLGSKDDAGNGSGRFRLNMDYRNAGGAMGFKIRLNWENWSQNAPKVPDFPYAFGYGNFLDDQLTLSVGILGASPWGTGGPEMWKELDVSNQGGMRVEVKPNIVPGLNVGFILNYFNSPREAGNEVELTLAEILKESVLGISYTHEYFMARLAYRLDSEYDQRVRGVVKEGDELVYRVEERIIQNYLPGFQIWALGYFAGVGAETEECISFTNWLFVQYAPDLFTAQVRFGFDIYHNRTLLYVRPNFYWNFFDKFLVAGAMFQFGQDFGEGKVHPGSPFYNIMVEPKIQVNFSPTAYVAFAYNWYRVYTRETESYIQKGKQPIKQTQWMNLYMGLTF